MSDKDDALAAIGGLPDDASYERIMRELYILTQTKLGLVEARQDKLVDHDEVKKRISKCL